MAGYNNVGNEVCVYVQVCMDDFSTLVKILKFDLKECLSDVNITILNDKLMESNETFLQAAVE